MATLSVNNVNKNAPKWWKRLESALLIGLIPSYTGFITTTPLEDSIKVWALAGGAFFGGLVKTVGILIGEDKNNEDNV